ncbi:MAG: hypothetical protein GY869_32425 [Planctomycetes bacterium]|nr:hypothetical protein [Planctomycetota bacterium]
MKDDLKLAIKGLAGEIPGFLAVAVVVVEDGLAVAEITASPQVEVGAAAAYLTSVVKSNLKTIKLLADGQVTDDILITTDKNYFLIRHTEGKPFFLFVQTNRDEWLGRTRLVMRKYEELILKIMN